MRVGLELEIDCSCFARGIGRRHRRIDIDQALVLELFPEFPRNGRAAMGEVRAGFR